MTIRDDIRQLLTGTLHAPADLGDDDSLFEGGALEARALCAMIAFIEERYVIDVAGRDVRPENFDSIAKIEAYVERKLAELQTSRLGAHWAEDHAAT
ncbi:MAG: hypothetical protein IT372_01725 [Polyangiaceae bacterium]|nr:hypothetical protein [Polyangiaceae bacterium]